MRFNVQHEGHLSEYLHKVMDRNIDMTWSEKVALGVVVIALGQDGGEGATKADLTEVLRHGIKGLLAKGILEKEEDGSVSLVQQKKAEKKPMQVDAAEPEAEVVDHVADHQTPPEVA